MADGLLTAREQPRFWFHKASGGRALIAPSERRGPAVPQSCIMLIVFIDPLTSRGILSIYRASEKLGEQVKGMGKR
jgi:hypothetical protein